MKKVLVALLVFCLCSPAAFAADLRGSAAKEAARLAAAQEPSNKVMGMHPAFFWGGLSLLGAGATGAAYLAATSGGEDCSTSSGPGWTRTVCVHNTGYGAAVWVPLAIAPMAAGGVLWILGKGVANRAASVAPTVVPVRGGWMAQKRIRF